MGQEQSNYMLAMICAMIANFAQSFGSKNPKSFSPLDFLPKWDGEDSEDKGKSGRAETVEEMKALFHAMAASSKKKEKVKTKKRQERPKRTTPPKS